MMCCVILVAVYRLILHTVTFKTITFIDMFVFVRMSTIAACVISMQEKGILVTAAAYQNIKKYLSCSFDFQCRTKSCTLINRLISHTN